MSLRPRMTILSRAAWAAFSDFRLILYADQVPLPIAGDGVARLQPGIGGGLRYSSRLVCIG